MSTGGIAVLTSASALWAGRNDTNKANRPMTRRIYFGFTIVAS
jgi:hypothetical protein